MNDVAIITGGTGAIGGAVAGTLQNIGLTIVAADLEEIPVPAGQVFQRCDVTDPQSLTALFERAESLGTVRHVIACHGILLETTAGSGGSAAVDKVLNINLNGVAHLCDMAAARISQNSCIVLISSVTSFMGRAKNAYAYQASKAGVESLTRTFAVACGPKGIRVNCIAPGWIDTEMTVGLPENSKKDLLDRIPVGKIGKPEDIAYAAVFLASDEASYITGQTITIDGGRVIN